MNFLIADAWAASHRMARFFKFMVAGAVLGLSFTGAAHAQDTPSGWTLDLSGAHRVHYEYLDNPFRPGRTEDEAIVSLRTAIVAKARKGGWEFGAELHDARAYGADDVRNLTAGIVNAVEPLQYYVRYTHKNAFAGGGEVGAQVGRFTWALGSGRVIGRNIYRNTIFTFAGARAHIATENGNRLDAFWMMPGQIRPVGADAFDDNEIAHDMFDDDFTLAGFFGESTSLLPGITSRAYAIWMDEEDNIGKRETFDRNLFTLGAQFQKKRTAGAWDFDIEGALQRGERRATRNPADVTDLNVRASFLHAEVGYSVADSGLNVAATYDFASGDEDPTDGRSGLYDPIFGPIRGDLGPTGLFTMVHRNNMSAPGARVLYKPGTPWDLMFQWQAIWLDSAFDTFGRIGVRDITGQSGTFAGHQIQMRARVPLVQDRVKLEVGAVSFQNGEFFNQAPNATGAGNPLFTYVSVEFLF